MDETEKILGIIDKRIAFLQAVIQKSGSCKQVVVQLVESKESIALRTLKELKTEIQMNIR